MKKDDNTNYICMGELKRDGVTWEPKGALAPADSKKNKLE